MNKTLAIIGAIVLLAVGGFIGYSVHAPAVQQAAGDTSSTAKIAQVVLDLSTTTPTTVGGACKLYNSDARDRVIDSVSYYLSGLAAMNGTTANGIAVWTWSVATGTSAYANVGNSVLNTTVATSSPYLYVASTTPGLTTTVANRLWKTGTCLNVITNGTSTAATGIIRVDYSQGQ